MHHMFERARQVILALEIPPRKALGGLSRLRRCALRGQRLLLEHGGRGRGRSAGEDGLLAAARAREAELRSRPGPGTSRSRSGSSLAGLCFIGEKRLACLNNV